jgi:hypothetical protein
MISQTKYRGAVRRRHRDAGPALSSSAAAERVVCAAVAFSASSPHPAPAELAGVIANFNCATVALAVELQPDLQQVFVVSGAEAADRAHERGAGAASVIRARLMLTYLSAPDAGTQSRLRTVPERPSCSSCS